MPVKFNQLVKRFFTKSECLGHMVLRPLSHITMNWELQWDHELEEYEREEDSFAGLLNDLIKEIGQTSPVANYHESEDWLAEAVIRNLRWKIEKENSRWKGADYESILEQGGFDDVNESRLVMSAAGRIDAAIKRGQLHFDEMEEGHQKILASVLCIVLYHRMHLLDQQNSP